MNEVSNSASTTSNVNFSTNVSNGSNLNKNMLVLKSKLFKLKGLLNDLEKNATSSLIFDDYSFLEQSTCPAMDGAVFPYLIWSPNPLASDIVSNNSKILNKYSIDMVGKEINIIEDEIKRAKGA